MPDYRIVDFSTGQDMGPAAVVPNIPSCQTCMFRQGKDSDASNWRCGARGGQYTSIGRWNDRGNCSLWVPKGLPLDRTGPPVVTGSLPQETSEPESHEKLVRLNNTTWAMSCFAIILAILSIVLQYL